MLKPTTLPDSSGQAVRREVSVGWCVPIQVAGLGAGVSFCCAHLELPIPHVHRGNTEVEKSSSASLAVSAYSDTQVSLTPWKG